MDATTMDTRRLATIRMGVGFLQGGLLYGLYRAVENKVWPATEPTIFAPILLLALLIPTSALFALGSIRPRGLASWLAGSTAILAGLAVHDMARRGALPIVGIMGGNTLAPTAVLLTCAPLLMFVGQSLVTASDRDRRPLAAYPTYFDTAWKLAIQANFAASFVGVMWGILLLGAGLFKLIGLTFLAELIKHGWFGIPVSTLAFAAAIHLTDVRAGIIHAIRSLSSVLLSWLLPLMAAILAGFLSSLPFTGMEPLWKTGHAAALLLGAAAGLVVLLNAAYQDGLAEHAPPRALRAAGRLAAVLILPLIAIAAYALFLRVRQYGWTVDRILATACAGIGALYGIGYLWAAVERHNWLKRLAPTNVAGALAMLVVALALLSPVADPARIAVASQMERLQSGQVPPEKFDFRALRKWGRYGEEALRQLVTDTANPVVQAEANRALLPFDPRQAPPSPAAQADIAANLVSFPMGSRLPSSFLQHEWSKAEPSWLVPACLRQKGMRCDAFMLDLDGDHRDDLLLVPEGTGSAVAFGSTQEEAWRVLGHVAGPAIRCARVVEAMRAGEVATVTPPVNDLIVGDLRIRIDTNSANPFRACP